ncbi:MAG: hypothetical protein KH431_09690 [Erysipelotrichaceae bacterium]|nr:hypothetical protein [Erysipelotrichaceae bacterium]
MGKGYSRKAYFGPCVSRILIRMKNLMVYYQIRRKFSQAGISAVLAMLFHVKINT